ARYRQGRGRLGAAAEAERQDGAARQFAGQRDIARPGDAILPAHRAVLREILPAVTGADIADAGAAKGVGLVLVGGGERHAERALLGPQHAPAAIAFDGGDVVVTGGAE